MAKKIKQLRFYNFSSDSNDPSSGDILTAWTTGSIISNYKPIV
jgi:hypothetical protein